MILSILGMGVLAKVVQVMLVSSFKFIFAPFLAAQFGFDFIQSFITVSFGGIFSVIFFYLLSEYVLLFVERNRRFFKKYFKFEIKLSSKKDKKPKTAFNKKNRMIIKILKKYGLLGIVVLTPVFLTIPLGTFLATRYYHDRDHVLLYLSASVIFWAFVISAFALVI